MTAAIRTEGLTKHYGGVAALMGLDLEVAPGEIFGFLGPNGAGKTTTIRLLLDEIRPTAGRAWIAGLRAREDAVELRRRLGYVPGDLALYPDLTGRETLRYLASLRGGVDWEHVGSLADRLDADLTRRVGDLSTGNRQKVGLIQGFMNRPQVLVMDEPSSGLDPLVQREFQEIMRDLVAEGSSVFLSSHTLSEVQRVADRVGIIRGGQLIALERVSALRAKAMRHVELELDGPADPADFAIGGVHGASVEGNLVTLAFDGPMQALLEAATSRHALLDIRTQEADLEEIFLTYYQEEGR